MGSRRIGSLEPRNTIPPGYVDTLRGASPDSTIQVYASASGVELVAIPCLLSPKEARGLISLLEDAAKDVER
jgi:hypothetical protein